MQHIHSARWWYSIMHTERGSCMTPLSIVVFFLLMQPICSVVLSLSLSPSLSILGNISIEMHGKSRILMIMDHAFMATIVYQNNCSSCIQMFSLTSSFFSLDNFWRYSMHLDNCSLVERWWSGACIIHEKVNQTQHRLHRWTLNEQQKEQASNKLLK